MAAIFNIYNKLESTYWKPVNFNVVGDQVNVKKIPILFDNGMYFYLHTFLKNSNDFTFNKKTGTFLTNFLYNSYFLKNNVNPSINNELTKIESPITSSENSVYSIYNANSSIPNNPTVLKNSEQLNFSKVDTIEFLFKNDYVVVKNIYGRVLTSDYIGVNGISFKTEEYPPADNQKFDYFLGNNSIVLFEYKKNYTNILIKNSTSNTLVLSSISLTSTNNLPETSILKFTSYDKKVLNIDNSVYDSYIVKYKTDPTKNENNLEIDYSFSNQNLLSQNYLGLFPVENPDIQEKECLYDFQIQGLKNYQTPEYKYTTANPLLTASPSIRRIYNKIFSGTNQNKGYEKLFLGFQSDTKEYTFTTDDENLFYYPPTCNREPLSSVGLIEDGAIAGEVPFTSDRISIYRTNYEEQIPGGPQPKSITKYDNTWLCSWLSGTNLGDKVWFDRYYNSAYYTLDQALTAKTMVYNQSLSANVPFTFDVPSSIILEPGVLYKYDRSGKQNSIDFIKHLDSDINNPLGAKVLSITSWLSSPLIDDSNYKNNGLVFFNAPENFKEDYWVLNGTNHAVFPTKTSLLQKSRFTISMWLNVDDWNNIYGDQIFGNYYESGFGLINDGALNVPLFTITNTASAVVYNINYKFTKLSEIPLPVNTNNSYSFIQRLPDYSYWVFDSKQKTGIKYNPINNIVASISSLPPSVITNIDQIELDSDQNFYFYDNTLKSFLKINQLGEFISQGSFSLDSGINRIEIDNNNVLLGIYGNASTIDNNNNVWEVVGGNLYKNQQIYANVGVTQQIICDSENNLWIAHEQDKISKLNTISGLFEFSSRLGKNSGKPLNPCVSSERFRYINLLKIPKNTKSCDQSSSYENNLIIVDTRDNSIYTLDSTGYLLSKLDLIALLSDPKISLNFYANGDFSGYQFARKFGGINKLLSWKLKIAEPNGNNYKLISLSNNVNSLPKGWHNFSLVFDSLNGIAKSYIDSIEVNNVSFEPRRYQVYYDYRSSLLLGAATIKNTTLNDIIGIDNSNKFIGSVADLRMYSKALTQGEVEQIYFASNFADSRKDLNWNVRVGDRNFLEEIEYFYKAQLPGSKSKYFNINIHNLNIDNNIKMILEEAIKTNISKIIPAESSLYKINWM
jgi:hypothetical protein